MRGRVPRVARRAPVRIGAEAAIGELDGVGLPADYRELATQRPNNQPFMAPFYRQLARTAGEGRIAGDTEQVLDRDRDTLQRAEIVMHGERRVGEIGFPAHAVRIERLVSVERLPPRLMVGNRPIGDSGGAQPACAQPGDDGFERGCLNAQVGHRGPIDLKRSSAPRHLAIPGRGDDPGKAISPSSGASSRSP